MIIKITRVVKAEIKDESLEAFKKALAVEDKHAENVQMETDFDDEGQIVDYLSIEQTSTVEAVPEGEVGEG